MSSMLANHEVWYLVVGLDAPPHDGTKSIKHADLSSFLKIMKIVIANNIDHWLYKTEVSMDWARFMIWFTFGVCIDLARYIFSRIQLEASYIMIDILPFWMLLT